MDAFNLQNIAKEYAEKVWQERGDYVSTYFATLTVLISDGGHIYTGITGISVNYGDIEILRSEKGAAAAMVLDGFTFAKQMVTISFKTRKVVEPNEDALKLLYELDHRNANLSIITPYDNERTLGSYIGVTYDPAKEEEKAAAAAAQVQPSPEPAPESEPVSEPEPAPEPEVTVEDEADVSTEAEAVAEESSEEVTEEVAADTEENSEEAAEEVAADTEEPSEEAAEEVAADTEETSEEVTEEAEAADEENSEEATEEAEVQEEEPEEAESTEETSEESAEQPASEGAADITDEALDDFMMGFDFSDDEAPSEIVVPKVQKTYEEYDNKKPAAPQEIEAVDSVKIDESNPFYEAPAKKETKRVVTFADKDNSRPERKPKEQPAMTKKEMLKKAKQRKKVAKTNSRNR